MIDPPSNAGRKRPDCAIDKPDAIILSHQRSGTHFLQACLASHPDVAARDECFMHFRKLSTGERGEREARLISYRLRNEPGRCNLAIVMYSQVPLLEEFCCALTDLKIIHLVREPRAVAMSFAQMRADKAEMGEHYRPHYAVNETPHRACPVKEAVDRLEREISAQQAHFHQVLAAHLDVLTVTYEELTGNQQTQTLSPTHARRILSFLGLAEAPLVNQLRKTSLSQPTDSN
ncbi:MAG TPA: sulfotransferase [Opitutaceae bacterium]|nr:sulfotransferase [Opitutaceae bacterium]